jgi:hypothetical protein
MGTYLRAIFPSDESGYTALSDWHGDLDEDVELAGKGRRWAKHILTINRPFRHPTSGKPITITDEMADQLIANFKAGRTGPPPAFCLADEKNNHSEAPERVAGVVTDIRKVGDRLVADLDVRRDDVADGLERGTILGASAYLSLNGTDQQTGERVGPILYHVAATSRPFLTDLSDYAPIEDIAATAWSDDPEGSELVMLTAFEDDDLDAIPGVITEDEPWTPDFAPLSALLAHVLSGAEPGELLGLTANGVGEDVAAQLVQLSLIVAEHADQQIQLANQQLRITGLEREMAEAEVDAYVRAGRALPRAKDLLVAMRLSGESVEPLLVAADAEPLVRLNAVRGYGEDESGSGVNSATGNIDREIERLTSSPATSRYFDSDGKFQRPGGRRHSNGHSRP